MVLGVPVLIERDSEKCGDCGRVALARGTSLRVEGAWNNERHAPVLSQLEELRLSRRRGDATRYEDLMDSFERLAIYGVLEPTIQWRQLEGELWEIKTAEDRVPAYVRPADRTHVKAVRLSHLFQKKFGKTAEGRTPRKHITKGLWMMGKDREHDNA